MYNIIWREARLNIVQIRKIDISVYWSMRFTKPGLSQKMFEKRAHMCVLY